MKKSILILALHFFVAILPAQETYTYLMRDTNALKLDVYQPAVARPDRACAIYVFGGGFAMGARNDSLSKVTCQALVQKGFVTVSIDYRLFFSKVDPGKDLCHVASLFDTAISQAVQDCAAAIHFVCDHAKEWNIDTSKIVLTGCSAGAITVLQTDYCRCNGLPAVAALPEGFCPAAVIPFSGAVYCHNKDFRYANNPAPTYFIHGMQDRIVNYNKQISSLSVSLYGPNRMAKLFEKNGYFYCFSRMKGHGHEISMALPQMIDEFCFFVDGVLAGKRHHFDAECSIPEIPDSKWGKMSVFRLYMH